ncbi:MAG: MerR family transcriptional regulator [Sandaracinaceae bacterium]|nr:MerR family transcriptional regulator [Sandaracinaceae bacterium]
MVGVKPHVLRYWEGEFDQLRPKKTRGAHRHFTRADVDMAMQIRRLLHDEGYTVAGAKLRLAELSDRPAVAPKREVALRAELLALRADLMRALAQLDAREHEHRAEPEAAVRVESVVPAVARLRHPTRQK